MELKLIVQFCIVVAAVMLDASARGQQPTSPPNGQPLDLNTQLKRDADAAYRRREFSAAVQLATQALSQTPGDAVALYLRGSARVELGIAGRDTGLIREGIEDARRAIQADRARNANFYLPYLYGMTHLTALEANRQHAQTAVTVATEVLGRTGLSVSSQSNILYQRALAHARLDEHRQAVDDFRRTLDLDAAHLAARLALAESLLRLGEAHSAEDEFSAAVAQFPDNPLVYNNRGMFYQSQQRHADAIADFTKALELSPDHLEARLNRGFTRLSSGDYPAAEADFERAVELQPDHAPAHSLLATSKLMQNDVRGAFDGYLKVIELRPSYGPARADIGFAYFFSRHYDTAAQAFEQALTLAPDSRFLVPWRYAALVMAGRTDEANQQYQSVAETPADRRDWFDQLTLFLMGKIDEEELLGAADVDNPTQRDAQLCEAYYFIGLRRQKDGQGDPARYFRRAVESRSTQLSAYRAATIELSRLRE